MCDNPQQGNYLEFFINVIDDTFSTIISLNTCGQLFRLIRKIHR